jgi:Rps23 Pro-64 3,4-dihydroxylase Tpa1-like proline 4-hydroxylase
MWNPALRSNELESVFREHGFGVIDGALEAAEAESIRDEIGASESAFKLVARTGVHPQRLAFDRALSETKLRVLEAQLAVAQQAGLLTSLHELWEPPDSESGSAISRLFAHLRSAQTLAWIEGITSVAVDECQVRAVTRFRQGHYVDPHSDRLVKFGKRRRIAFVFFFSQDPALRECGNLVLLRRDGGTEASIEPRFNRFALLDVDRIHQHCVPKVLVDDSKRLAIPGFFCAAPSTT